MTVTTTTFNGKTYQVYPVRLPQDNSDGDRRSAWDLEYGDGILQRFHPDNRVRIRRMFEESNIGSIPRELHVSYNPAEWTHSAHEFFLPYNPFQLPDGDYLAYYEKRALEWDEFHRPIYSHEDTTIVAVTFTLKSNKKHGKVTWYDFEDPDKQHVLQQGFYSKGLKDSTWTLYRQYEKKEYTYLKNKLNGLYRFWRNDRIKESTTYVLGVKNGASLIYHPGKKTVIERQLLYEAGTATNIQTYDKKGKLLETTSYLNDSIKHTREFNHKGVLVREDTLNRKTNYRYRTLYYDDGSLQSKALAIAPEKTESWTIYLPYDFDKRTAHWRRLKKYSSEIVTRSWGYTENVYLNLAWYHPNGTPRLAFDLRKDSLKNTVFEYDEKGRVTKSYEVQRDTLNALLITYINPKTGLPSQRVWKSQYSTLGNSHYDKDGNLTSLNLQSAYLDERFEDSTGFVMSDLKMEDGIRVIGHTLLHTNETVYSQSYKGHDLKTTSFRNLTRDKSPWAEVRLSEFDKSGEFEIRHTRRIYTPKMDRKDPFIRRAIQVYYLQQDMDFPELDDYPDSLDYQVFYKGVPFSGEIRYKERFKSHRKIERHGYTVEFDKKASKRDRTNILNVTHYRRGPNYGQRTLGFYDGHLSSSKYWGSTVHYFNQKRYGESSVALTEHYKRGIKHGFFLDYDGSKEYYEGKLHGDVRGFGYYSPEGQYERQLNYKAQYHLDTLHGPFQKLRPTDDAESICLF